ncbi:MAG: hypothetical protein HYR94_19710 [Chloroflexi bacterium]|nr:hypothetical protein [Chloroflexota bacterium]
MAGADFNRLVGCGHRGRHRGRFCHPAIRWPAPPAVVTEHRTLTTDERTFGITVFEADSEEKAREIMNNDPAVIHGVMRAELYPFRIVLMTDKKID